MEFSDKHALVLGLSKNGLAIAKWLARECSVLLLEPNSTLNTGNVETGKTRKTLERLG